MFAQSVNDSVAKFLTVQRQKRYFIKEIVSQLDTVSKKNILLDILILAVKHHSFKGKHSK